MKAWKIADQLRAWKPLPADGWRRCLILWWGSLRDMDATVGDCMAVANLALGLQRRGLLVEIAAFHDLRLPGIKTVHPAAAHPRRYRAVCFACGPLRARRKVLDLVRRYRSCYRLAAGVSVLPGETAILSEFDDIVARDGVPGAAFDLALADPWRGLFPQPDSLGQAVASCFRGAQSSVGSERPSLHDRAEGILRTAAQHASAGDPVIGIDTVAADHAGIAAVMAKFAQSRLVLTTRLHGALLALEMGIPFVAIDQIAGGHKVSEVLKRVGWPFVFNAETAQAGQVADAVATVLDPEFAPQLQRYRATAVQLANQTLARACDAVRDIFPATGTGWADADIYTYK